MNEKRQATIASFEINHMLESTDKNFKVGSPFCVPCVGLKLINHSINKKGGFSPKNNNNPFSLVLNLVDTPNVMAA